MLHAAAQADTARSDERWLAKAAGHVASAPEQPHRADRYQRGSHPRDAVLDAVHSGGSCGALDGFIMF